VQRLRMGSRGTSHNTLLRLIRWARLPSADEVAPDLRVLGVDDFAFRRGLRYGALLVDLEHHRVLDLLPDREAATLATWLRHLPQGQRLEVVSRDRGGAFADGARQGAPQALQVADRFHVVKNLGQALDRLLAREHHVLTRALATVAADRSHPLTGVDNTTSAEQPTEPLKPPVAPPTRGVRERAVVDDRRRAIYDRVVALAAEGHSLREVALRAGVSRETVRSYLRVGQYRPSSRRTRKPHACDPFAVCLRQRWEAGEHNGAALYAAIRQQGYTGAVSTVRQYVQSWRTGPRRSGRRRRGEDAVNASPPHRRRFSPRQTRWLLVRSLADLDAQERAYRQALCQLCQQSVTIATAQHLVEDFGRIIRTHAPSELDPWLEAAGASHIPELKSFANGIRRDYEAVLAAVTSPYSQGQVEGQGNRLKLLKRQSYGRGAFDLLRRRVLYHAA